MGGTEAWMPLMGLGACEQAAFKGVASKLRQGPDLGTSATLSFAGQGRVQAS